MSSHAGGRIIFMQWTPPNPVSPTEHGIRTPKSMATTIREEEGEEEMESEEKVEGLVGFPQYQHIPIPGLAELVVAWAKESVGLDRIPQTPGLYPIDEILDSDDPGWDDPGWNWLD